MTESERERKMEELCRKYDLGDEVSFPDCFKPSWNALAALRECWQLAQEEQRERDAKIGRDYLREEQTDDDYWLGGRHHREAVALYVQEIEKKERV